jgi:flagellar motor switch protein FliN/FliY
MPQKSERVSTMASNRRILDLWIDVVGAELEELLGVPVTARVADEVPHTASAYRSRLLFEGPVQGAMYVTVSAAGMMQLAQMIAGEPVDPHAAWTEEGLEAWQIWLTAAAAKLAICLMEEFPESQDPCVIGLRETTAVEGTHPASGPDTAATGAVQQQWLLRAGENEIALSASVRVEFPGEEADVSAGAAAQAANVLSRPKQQEMENSTQQNETGDALPSALPGPSAAGVAPEDTQAGSSESHRQQPTVAPRSDDRAEDRADGGRWESESDAPSRGPASKQRLDLLLDIELETTLRFGALELPLREVLEIGPGDVLPLDRNVQDMVDLVVGDRIVARGEVVLVGGNFAVHVIEVAEPRRRLETIRRLF